MPGRSSLPPTSPRTASRVRAASGWGQKKEETSRRVRGSSQAVKRCAAAAHRHLAWNERSEHRVLRCLPSLSPQSPLVFGRETSRETSEVQRRSEGTRAGGRGALSFTLTAVIALQGRTSGRREEPWEVSHELQNLYIRLASGTSGKISWSTLEALLAWKGVRDSKDIKALLRDEARCQHVHALRPDQANEAELSFRDFTQLMWGA